MQEIFTAEEKKRCRLDGANEEDGTQRLPNVDVVPAPDRAHVLREKQTGKAMRHPYRGMPLTGAPAARFPKYLWSKHFDDYADLDENGHAPETLDIDASEHESPNSTGWLDYTICYILSAGGLVQGFRKPDKTMATNEDL